MKRLILGAVACLALTSSCKKTVEGESKAFVANEKKAKELAAIHPGMKAAIEAEIKSAQAELDKAKGMSGEAAAEQMAKANGVLNRGVVGQLGQIDGQIKNLNRKVIEAAGAGNDESEKKMAKAAAKQAKQTVESVQEMIKKGATDPDGARAIIKKALSDLREADTNLGRVISKAKQAAKAKKGKDQMAPGKPDAKKPAPPAKAETWKCEYCGNMHPVTEHKCSSCGAARPDPNKKKKDKKKKKKK